MFDNPFSPDNGGTSHNPIFTDNRSEDLTRLDELLEEAEDAIAFGDFEDKRFTKGAASLLSEITETLPRALWRKNPRFHLAMLMVELGTKDLTALATRYDEIAERPEFLRAREYARESDPALSARLEELVSSVQHMKEEAAEAAKEEAERKAKEEAERKAAEFALIQELFEIEEDGNGTYLLVRAEDPIIELDIPDGYISTIGENAFRNNYGLTSATIPNGVISIGDYAFCNCIFLTSITIPNSVTSIGERAFSDCSFLTSVTIPNSVTSIGDYAFCDCSSLASVTIPNSVTSIGEHAFWKCSSLASVTIPNGITSIGYHAFRDCFYLTSVTLPTRFRGHESRLGIRPSCNITYT